MESLEAGKPISDCAGVDLPDLVMTMRWHAEACDKIYDQLSPSGSGFVGMVVREPIGVVGAVLPWNYPLMMAGWKIGPILAAGNTCIVKPAEQTSTTTIRIAELAIEAGIPDGVFNVVPGFGETAGAAVGLHPDVDCVGFTGSTEVGRMFLEYSARSNLKEVLLECGGKSPVIVMADADDLDQAASGICEGIFWNAGQNCSANSRLIVHRSVEEELLERISERSGDWMVGDPLVPETTVGSMIEEAHMDKVLGHIADAHAAGSTCAIGGNRVRVESGGWFVEPTVFTNVDPSSRLAREEGKTILLTSHQMDVVEALADRVIIIQEGRVIAEGTPAELKRLFDAKSYRLEIRLAGGLSPATQAHWQLHEVETDGERHVFHFVLPEPHRIYRLLDELEAAGAELLALQPDLPDLEEAYVRLVQRNGNHTANLGR
jgi:delta 1-pyrroline-5-carboxylate dehydrogenase